MYSRVFCGDRSKKPPFTKVYFDELVCGFSQLSKADAKPILYQKKWCPGAESNHRHEDFQSTALPLSYPGTGTAFAVGWRRSMTCYRQCPEAFSHFFNVDVVALVRDRKLLFQRPLPAAMEPRRTRSATWPDQYQHTVSNRMVETRLQTFLRRSGSSFQHFRQRDTTAFAL
ncbi:hypothetical protein RUM4293_04400 [Ruegeria atlantica]|uniref:Uncharacterized protein n=1 Tax=Ruegeria atlantica TaxID=81569 RepID=A0A0N7LPK6_9RHOB|nr:hypothetical protein RUM4293_04400 [Ruegeria atlantica]